ncbi:hypothetical protein OF83DRAFT_1151853 [Amylostereum chailletii]|nr:hypothetical protein OF83DRAFT_1151853 [Amylostereum chailletii]
MCMHHYWPSVIARLSGRWSPSCSQPKTAACLLQYILVLLPYMPYDLHHQNRMVVLT